MSDEVKPVSFTLQLAEQPIEIVRADGTPATYTLRELTGLTRDQYVTGFMARLNRDPTTGKILGMKDIRGMYAALLCLSLFDENNQPVAANVIQGWPAKMQRALYEMAQKISGLQDEAERTEEAKND